MVKSKKVILSLVLLLAAIGFSIVYLTPARAADQSGSSLYEDIKTNQLNPLATVGLLGSQEKDNYDLLGQIAKTIKVVLGTLVIIFMSLIIFAGFKWLTSGGNEQTIADAKKMISAALIGVVIIFFAYAITVFVFNLILNNKIS
jgi:hypothetical protein